MLLWYIYVQPLPNIVLWMALAIMLWGALGWCFTKQWRRSKLWRAINALLLVAASCAALYATLAREPSAERELMLIPLYSFIAALEQVEHWRMMVMNTFLFLPFGLALSNALPKSMPMKVRLRMTALGGLILSLVIECLQFAFRLGTVQTDDLIFNTLGAALGVLSIGLWRYLPKVYGYVIEHFYEETDD